MSDKKQQLKRMVIKELYFSNVLSSADLSLKIDKSLPITTQFISDLINEGTVVETGLAPSTGGRRAAMYSLGSDVLFVVSVAMDQFVTRVAIMDMHNNVVGGEVKIILPLAGNKEALTILIDKIEEVIEASTINKNKIAGIGIGMPGFVDIEKGINYSFMPVKDKNITQTIYERLKINTYIDNDSSVIALAESKFGAAVGIDDAMVINAGWGIGLGMILNGKSFRGHNGFAGEFSHLSIFNNGKLCYCGKTGCLETEASLLVVVEKAREELKAGRVSRLKLDYIDQTEEFSDAIIQAAHEGDRFSIELLSDAGYKIGKGVAILIHLLNPEVIVVSGRGSAAGRIWLAPMEHAINEHCIPRLASKTSLKISTLGYGAELIGAAALVMEHFA